MDIFEQTKQFINMAVRRYYYKAIEAGAVVTDVEYVGAHLYKVNVGNMNLTYMGTVEVLQD